MLRLKLDYSDSIPLEVEGFTPDQLSSLSIKQIQNIPLWQGNRKWNLGDMARIEGSPEREHLILEGDWSKVKRIGQGMKTGLLEIHGASGWHTGSGMKGGKLIVHGNAGDWSGAEMRGGLLEIHGNGGNSLGAGYPGARSGMRGGEILVHGNAGNEIGGILRRGLIVVLGTTGDFAGLGMIAGSLILMGGCGIRPGAAMKRGSIVCGRKPLSILPSFSPPNHDRPLWLNLLKNHLNTLGVPNLDQLLPSHQSWNISKGDRVALGMGELLWVS